MSVSIRQMRFDATQRLVSKETVKARIEKNHSPSTLPSPVFAHMREKRCLHEEIDERKERDAPHLAS